VNAETESLACYLDEQRDSVLEIAGGLPEAALRRAVFPSGWTCPELVRYLAAGDGRNWFRGVAAGEPAGFPAGEDPGWLAGPEAAAGEVSGPCRGQIARMPSSWRRRG
jgi:Protein of unknown function (DUF664)